jgi:hypothetical protein
MAIDYEVVVVSEDGHSHVHPFTAETELNPGSSVRFEGRDWLVDRVEPGDGGPPRVILKPGRYRLVLRHPDGREEYGAFRRFRRDRPRVGHAFTTMEQGQPIAWQVLEERLVSDERGDPYLELIAERDYSEYEQLPDHELEHALARGDDGLPPAVATWLSAAESDGMAVELMALDAGEAADWPEAERFIDALVIDMVETDLLENCGVDIGRDPRETWLPAVKERLAADLASFRGDIEGDHDQIEEWEFTDGRIFASRGQEEDEKNPDSGHGWMCRLLDGGALTAAGFARVRRPAL